MEEKEDEYQLTADQMKSIQESFRMFVVADRNEIPVKRLLDVMKACGYALKPDELAELISDVDLDSSGYIDFEEFLPLMKAHIKKKEDEAFYKNLFRMLDKKRKGVIPVDDLRFILMGLAAELDFTEEDVDDMIHSVDEDGNGEVSFEEFLQLMTSE